MTPWHAFLILAWLLPLAYSTKDDTSACTLIPYSLRVDLMTSPLAVQSTQPKLSWQLKSSSISSCKNQSMTAYRILVDDDIGYIEKGQGRRWDSGKVATNATYAIYGGLALSSLQRTFWTVIVWDQSGASYWLVNSTSPADMIGAWEAAPGTSVWQAAEWIQKYYASPPTSPCDFYKEWPVPLFRKDMTIPAGKIARARMYISGLGYYETYINGVRVGDSVLDPGLTSVNKTIIYSAYDIGDMIKPGQNTWGIMVGNGFFNPLPLTFWGHINLRLALFVGMPTVKAMIYVEYESGANFTVGTDDTWKVGSGPILRNNVYLGEIYDARIQSALKGWNANGYNVTSWPQVVTNKQAPLGVMTPQTVPPIRVQDKYPAVSMHQSSPGVWVFDLGVNFAGWAKFSIPHTTQGQTLVMRYGETVYPNGTIDTTSSSAGQILYGNGGPCAPARAEQTDTVVMAGGALEEWQPTFTWHGFRYVEIVGLTAANNVSLSMVTGLQLHSDVDEIGKIQTSSSLFNGIHSMFVQTLKSNLFSIQSDCPHRERFGYGGDAMATDTSIMWTLDMEAFYTKRMHDYLDTAEIISTGEYLGMPETAPFVGIADAGMGSNSGPIGWGSMFAQLQAQLYAYTADPRLMHEMYPATKSWLSFLNQYAEAHNGWIDVGLGDWIAIDIAPTNLTSNIFYHYNIALMASIADVVLGPGSGDLYRHQADVLAKSITARFASSSGKYSSSGLQGAQAFALWHQIVPAPLFNASFAQLVAAVEAANNHVSVGLFGLRYMMDVLAAAGRTDLVLAMLNQTSYPSYGYMLAHNATTLWETWQGDDHTSYNHPMLGAVVGWFYEHLAGFSYDVPSRTLTVAPKALAGGTIDWVDASYQHPYLGGFSSRWGWENDSWCINVTVPVNSRAQVVMRGGKVEYFSSGVYYTCDV